MVGSSAGGGYDTYARLLARHFGDALPGRPSVVVQNMSGAGSNRAAGFIYSVAPKDGTAIGAIFPGAVLQPLLSDAPVSHDPSKLVYLGSANSDVYVCYVRADAPVKTYQGHADPRADHRRQQPGRHHLRPAAAAQQRRRHQIPHRHRLSRQPRDHARARARRGAGRLRHRLDRHRDHASGLVLRPASIKPLVQLSNDGHPDLNKRGVPRAAALARNDDERRVIELVFSQGIFGRPFVLPPGVPAERLAALRKGFMAALSSEALRAEAAKMNLDIEPIPGDDLQTLVAGLYATPAHVVERARQALTAKGADSDDPRDHACQPTSSGH